MNLETGLIFFLAMLVFAVTPGPGIFAILANSLRLGTMASLPMAFGMAISDLVYLVAACLGLAALAEGGYVLFTLIRVLGAAYLFYLAVRMWQAPVVLSELQSGQPPAPQANADGQHEQRGMLERGLFVGVGQFLRGFLQGFLISASNPKVILFYLAFLPTFLDLTQLSAGDIAIASSLAFFALMLGLMLVAVLAAGARRKLSKPSSVRWLNRVAAGLMAGAGGYLLARSA